MKIILESKSNNKESKKRNWWLHNREFVGSKSLNISEINKMLCSRQLFPILTSLISKIKNRNKHMISSIKKKRKKRRILKAKNQRSSERKYNQTKIKKNKSKCRERLKMQRLGQIYKNNLTWNSIQIPNHKKN
jgi:hypothetical protein